MTFKQKWENYWYHYKWQTIGALFAVFLVVTSLESCINKTEPDLYVVYLSTEKIEDKNIDKFEKDLVSNKISKDINGDGKNVVHLEHIVSDFQIGGNTDQATVQRMQAVMNSGQYSLLLLHQYALEDFDGYFEDISHKVKDGDKTYKSPKEGYICAISVEGNKYLENMGINTENLYVAIRRRTADDAKNTAVQKHFDLAYKALEFMR